MSSSIFFRFKSRKDALQINFDGNSLSVFEVKREIMSIARLGDGKDFDLDIYTSDTSEIYDDDTTQIPRSTTVIVRRQPAQRPGAGRAARYVTGQMPLHAKNQHRVESAHKGAASKMAPTMNGTPGDGKALTEEERLQAVMSASNTQLKADLDMSAGKPVVRSSFNNNNNKAAAVPDKPLPPTYVCHRCGEKGHWIQACPTNNDPAYDGKHKFKRTTGIPRSMLEVVEKPDGMGEDGKIDPSKIDKGLMYTANGEWVRAKPDQAAWQKFQDQQHASAEKAKEAALGDQALRDHGLECSIDNRPFVDPVKTPCCGKTYCRDCIENAVLDADLTCPNCGEQVLLDNLEPDNEVATKLAEFEDEKKVEKQRKDKETSQSPVAAAVSPTQDGTPQPVEARSPSAAGTSQTKTTGLNSPEASTELSSRKRPAEDELENKRQPSNPAAVAVAATSSRPATPNTAQSATPQAQPQPQPPRAPKSMTDFVSQMNAMSGTMAGGQNGMNAFANPMMNGMPMGMPMGMNPMAMGMMNMGMNMNPMGMMPNFNMMNGMNGMNSMNGMGYQNMNGGMGSMGWQGQQPQPQQQQRWMNGMGAGNGASNDSPYMRQPVNPHRHQGKQRRQRSVDYKQM